ncbi:hypothetical protein [Microbacterium indicum]|uniref:hypothetical protein n=1 Tax=Microbacterium indicum TaxID=358100 RepID=UPI00048B562F|nr:hypothetical protein [Microbacterium indicum]
MLDPESLALDLGVIATDDRDPGTRGERIASTIQLALSADGADVDVDGGSALVLGLSAALGHLAVLLAGTADELEETRHPQLFGLCVVCSKPLPSRRSRYCSNACRNAADSERRRERYYLDPAYREAKLAAQRAQKASKRERYRSDPSYRARVDAGRRAAHATKSRARMP